MYNLTFSFNVSARNVIGGVKSKENKEYCDADRALFVVHSKMIYGSATGVGCSAKIKI